MGVVTMSPRIVFASLLTLGILSTASASRAEITGFHVNLSPYAGITLWDQTVRYEDKPIYGGRLGLNFGNRVSLEGTYGFCPTNQSVTPLEKTDVHHVGADLLVNLTRPHKVVPYVLGGWSALRFDPERNGAADLGSKDYMGFEVGAGVKVAMAERVGLRIDIRDVAVEREAPLPTEWAHNMVWSLGLDFLIGGHRADDDKDGVSNNKDKCPGTPVGALVDQSGCPTDADVDGVFDGLDQCSATPRNAKVDVRGCPLDTDGDGVFDGLDQCASTPHGAKVDAGGCPVDSDGDGVADGIDQCASTPAGAKVDANGCPVDGDGDGVPDGIDQCPNTPRDARVDANGCPIEVNEKETQLLDTGMIRINNVNFATGKAALQPESFAVLDEVGGILSQWPQLQIEIGGHCDSRGSDAANQALSEKRAQAVMGYLTSKFSALNPSQYSAKGYGESKPIADNKTAEGRAQNRRVEIEVVGTKK